MKRWVYPITLALNAALLGRCILYGAPNESLVPFLCFSLSALSVYAWYVYRLWGAFFIALHNLLYLLVAWLYYKEPLFSFCFIFLGCYTLVAFRLKIRYIQRCLHYEQSMTTLGERKTEKEQQYRQAENVREALGKKYNRYHNLQSIAESLSLLNNVSEVAHMIVNRAYFLIGKSDACLLLLVDPENQKAAVVASKLREGALETHAKKGDQFDHHVLKYQRPLLIDDVRKDFRFSISDVMSRRLRSLMACPIRMGQGVAGVLRLESLTPESYSQDDLRLLDILLDLSSAALTNARLFETTQILATTDGLTQLMLRRPFMETLRGAIQRAERLGTSFALILLDIDHFKRYNDSFGHMAGDLILKAVGALLNDAIPESATAARLGGEEFAVILPEAHKDQAMCLAESLREQVEKTFQEGRGRLKKEVTVSVGISLYPRHGMSEIELIRSADQQLYRAKSEGRNRVCLPS